MSDEDYRDDDKRFYGATAYNEVYYIEEENNLTRQSDLELGPEFEDVDVEEILQGEAKEILPGSHQIDYQLDVF
jgi:hypothetical protein